MARKYFNKRKGFTIYFSFAVILGVFFSYYMNSTVEVIAIRKFQKKLKNHLLKADRKNTTVVTPGNKSFVGEQNELDR
jgi:hypothetical protein